MRTLRFCFRLGTVLPLLALLLLTSCRKKDEPGLVGQPGNPRFNLQFDNEENVDLDLYVTDPNGETVSWSNPIARSGGELDVDCLCGACDQGPNENIFWPEDDSSPRGTYRVWVEYFDACGGGSPMANFTVRVLNNRQVIDTYQGTLAGGRSTVWTYTKR
jgi:uncharacterized protein YfaP (DUF2135 family)